MFKVEKARSCTILSSVPSITGRAAIGYDHGYVGQLFYLGLALDPAYIEGFIEVLRLRRARGIERQQIKWPAYTAVVAASGSVLTEITSEAIGLRWLEWLGFVVVIAALVGFPISIGIAIVRFRLYEIDTLINRTLVYGSLTVMLALVYFGGVTATQAIFRAFTPQEQQPQLVIVIWTLLIAALFNPLRSRIQGFIDRPFYRSKYDARQTLEAFSAKLRDETDLDAVSTDLVGVVRETMQPAHVSLWLRPDPLPRGAKGLEQVS